RIRPPNNEIDSWIAKSKSAILPAHIAVRNKYVMAPIAEGMEQLEKEISLVKPNVVVAFGNVSLWALTGKWGIKAWRGSVLSGTSPFSPSTKVIPAYHPAYILRDYSQRHITTHDLRKVRAESKFPEIIAPNYSFVIRPSYGAVVEYLENLLVQL